MNTWHLLRRRHTWGRDAIARYESNSGDRKGQWAVTTSRMWRIVFDIAEDDLLMFT